MKLSFLGLQHLEPSQECSRAAVPQRNVAFPLPRGHQSLPEVRCLLCLLDWGRTPVAELADWTRRLPLQAEHQVSLQCPCRGEGGRWFSSPWKGVWWVG